MPVKTTQKKVVKPTVRKSTVTLNDVWKTIDEIAKGHKEIQKIVKDISLAHKETQKTLKETQEAHKETEKVVKNLGVAHEKTEKAMKETQEAHKETEKAIKEAQEARKEAQEAHKETEKVMKEMQKNLGGLGNTLGSLVEHMMTPDLPHKFLQFGFTFDRITAVKWSKDNDNPLAEIDGLMENSRKAMAVEVKTTLEIKDINDHIKRMEKIRSYANEHGDKRKFLGAIAAVITTKKAVDYALAQGFYVIQPSGEDVTVIPPPGKAAIW